MRRAYAAGLLATAGILCPLFGASAEDRPPIELSEVSVAGESADDEFVELRNLSAAPVSIGGWQLRRKTASGSESSIRVFPSAAAIPAGGFYLWANSKGRFSEIADETSSSSSLANNNAVALYTKSGTEGKLVDSLAWGAGAPFSDATPRTDNPPKAHSLVKENGEWELSDSPSPVNSHGDAIPPEPPEEDDAPDQEGGEVPRGIFISEIYPNPEKGEDEFIELGNRDATDVSLAGWSLSDASKNGRYVFPSGASIPAGGFLPISKTAFKFALNNSNETVTLKSPSGAVIDEAEYGKTKKGVSLNRAGAGFRGGAPTPGSPNRLNALPEARDRVPEEGYEDIPVAFYARAKDEDGDDLKFTWDFGDGRKSRKAETRHTYEKTGKYTVTLRIDDGKDIVEEAFRITIKKFKAPKLQIMALAPNPEGKDAEHEWIQIRNDSERMVDLLGWSIASAAKGKKLVNHPITESLSLGKGETATLTRKHSKFSLNNTAGTVELRAPNKKKVRSVTYRSPESVAENSVYRHDPGQGWEWVIAPTVLGTSIDAPPPKTLDEILADEMRVLQRSLRPFAGSRLLEDPHLRKDPAILLSYDRKFSLPDSVRFTPAAIQFVDTKKAPATRLPLHFLEGWNARFNALFL